MPRRADEVIFISECPVFDCNNHNRITWHHYGCPFNIPLYISIKGKIRCDNCGMEDFYVNCKFNCGNHEGESFSAKFCSPSKLKKVLYSLFVLVDMGIISNDFMMLLAEALKQQIRKSKLNNNY